MKRITLEDITALDKVSRLNLINGITGFKPANLIGTRDEKGQENLAIFSSVVHLGSDPALIGMVSRPMIGYRHTIHNIEKMRYYTINQVNEDIYIKAHFTSVEFPYEVSEFEQCSLNSVYKDGFRAPYVSESKLQIGLELVEMLPIQANGTILIVGKVLDLHISDRMIDGEYNIDLEEAGAIAISGVDTYYKAAKLGRLPYARLTNIPNF